jgi:hypothetical protein
MKDGGLDDGLPVWIPDNYYAIPYKGEEKGW